MVEMKRAVWRRIEGYSVTRKEKFKNLAADLGALVGEKDEHYGEMMESTRLFLLSIFPDGIGTAQYSTVGLLVRVFDKLRRSAHDGHDNAEDWRDIAGYGLQGLAHYTSGNDINAVTTDTEATTRTAARERKTQYCADRESHGKHCYDCPAGRAANAEHIGCDQYVRLYSEEALGIMRKAVE